MNPKAQLWRAVYLSALLASLQTLWAAQPGFSPVNPLRDAVTVADFDGDSTPDIASSQSSALAAMHGKGSYVLRVQLSASAHAAIDIDAPVGGLDLWTVDIDADHDPDIILTARASGSRIGVLINDGSGQFDQQLDPEPGQPSHAKIRFLASAAAEPEVASPVSGDALTPAASRAEPLAPVEYLRSTQTDRSPVSNVAHARERAPPIVVK